MMPMPKKTTMSKHVTKKSGGSTSMARSLKAAAPKLTTVKAASKKR